MVTLKEQITANQSIEKIDAISLTSGLEYLVTAVLVNRRRFDVSLARNHVIC